MKTLRSVLRLETIQELFKEVRLGIEKESQRVTLQGKLAKTDHPAVLGNRNFHPTIQTDFSETQVEMITPVSESAEEVLDYLAAIHDVVLRSLEEGEMLWPLSMPPILPEKDEEIIIAKLERFEDVLYRRYLARSYGKRKQMVSGIHFNFEFVPELLEAMFPLQTDYQSMEEFKTHVYLKVSRNYLRYRWLITYLFGATPVSEPGYFAEGQENVPSEPVRSIRNSHFGYTNHEEVFVSYRTIDEYAKDIDRLVEHGLLSEEKEFYSAVRLRGCPTVEMMKTHGVNYIEIRNIDNNPFSPYGIDSETIRFLQLFLMYMLWLDNEKCDEDDLIKKGDKLNNQVALEHPFEKTLYFEEGQSLLDGMLEMADEINLSQEAREVIVVALEALTKPKETISGRMWSVYEQGISNQNFGVEKGLAYRQEAFNAPYQLAGFRDMELSTQLLMFDALQKGISVEVIDRHDQFLKLSHGKHIEYVKNANMTGKDSYVVPLIMENKTVTKKLLAKDNFRVPAGKEYSNVKSALSGFSIFKGKGIVVKPKSTNYGIGISIFKDGASLETFEEAIKLAFKEDTEVLVEEFIPGTEYRFFVINNEVKAIMLRVPANVVGDGKKTIANLVAEKNQDPLRGTHHRSPLEIIKLGDIEKLMLKEQGYTTLDILKESQVVHLRENSNVSTGGDSIDMTDKVDPSYKKIAVEAVSSLGAVISGIDLIIPDINLPARRNSTDYGIIEANFNPAMHMHAYPFAGKGRRLTLDVLNLLFPEILGEED